MQVGEARLHPVVEIEELQAPPEFFVNDITPAEVATLADLLGPRFFDAATGACRVSQHAWLIEVNGKRILVDPCVGHNRDRPAMPMFHQIESPVIERLEALGAPPESIDYVFCTHLHFDHVGWNTRLQDGRYVPTFPNARYLIPKLEKLYWERQLTEPMPGEEFNEGAYAECVAPVIEAGLADLVEPGLRIADCLTLIDAAGHTIGQLAGLLESEGEGIVLAGDAMHHPLHVVFPDRPFLAHDEGKAIATRLSLLELCADRDYWLAPAHFSAPHACKIRRDEGGYSMHWD